MITFNDKKNKHDVNIVLMLKVFNSLEIWCQFESSETHMSIFFFNHFMTKLLSKISVHTFTGMNCSNFLPLYKVLFAEPWVDYL